MYQDYRYVGLQCVRIIVVGVTMYQDFSCGGLQDYSCGFHTHFHVPVFCLSTRHFW